MSDPCKSDARNRLEDYEVQHLRTFARRMHGPGTLELTPSKWGVPCAYWHTRNKAYGLLIDWDEDGFYTK